MIDRYLTYCMFLNKLRQQIGGYKLTSCAHTIHLDLFVDFWLNFYAKVLFKCQPLLSILWDLVQCNSMTITKNVAKNNINNKKQRGKIPKHNHKLLFYYVVGPLVAHNYIIQKSALDNGYIEYIGEYHFIPKAKNPPIV